MLATQQHVPGNNAAGRCRVIARSIAAGISTSKAADLRARGLTQRCLSIISSSKKLFPRSDILDVFAAGYFGPVHVVRFRPRLIFSLSPY